MYKKGKMVFVEWMNQGSIQSLEYSHSILIQSIESSFSKLCPFTDFAQSNYLL